MKLLLLASRNEGKIREFKAILKDLALEIKSLRDFPAAPDPEERGSTFEENAVAKASAVAAWSGELSMADDSGLCVDALDGAPGVRSARFAGEEKDDAENCRKLLEMLKDVPQGRRGASFRCVIAVADPRAGVVGVAKGEYSGTIAYDMRGKNGFGYDPLFIDPATDKRFAELDPGEKNRISHRARALAQVREILRAVAVP